MYTPPADCAADKQSFVGTPPVDLARGQSDWLVDSRVCLCGLGSLKSDETSEMGYCNQFIPVWRNFKPATSIMCIFWRLEAGGERR